MGIPAEWTTVSRYLAVRFPMRVLGLGRKAEWKGSRGEFLPRCAAGESWASHLMYTLLHRFKSLKFLLTNSKVPRDTKKLVAGVGEKKANVSTR